MNSRNLKEKTASDLLRNALESITPKTFSLSNDEGVVLTEIAKALEAQPYFEVQKNIETFHRLGKHLTLFFGYRFHSEIIVGCEIHASAYGVEVRKTSGLYGQPSNIAERHEFSRRELFFDVTKFQETLCETLTEIVRLALGIQKRLENPTIESETILSQ